VAVLAAGCHFGDTRGSSIVSNTTTDAFKVRYMSEGQIVAVYDLPPGAVGYADGIGYPGGVKLQVLSTSCDVLGTLTLAPHTSLTEVMPGGRPAEGDFAVVTDERQRAPLVLSDASCGDFPSAAPGASQPATLESSIG
jgi:hypothetical protein